MKSMFSVQRLSQVEQVEIDAGDLQMNNPEDALNGPHPASPSKERSTKKLPKQNANPLFAQPG